MFYGGIPSLGRSRGKPRKDSPIFEINRMRDLIPIGNYVTISMIVTGCAGAPEDVPVTVIV